MNKSNLVLINDLTTDIIQLDGFINQIKEQKETQIKSMSILFSNDIQINLKGRFSEDSKNRLIDLIILSRTQIRQRLVDILSEINTDDTIYPVDTIKVVHNAANEF